MFFHGSPSRIVVQAEMVPYIWYLMKYLHAKWMKQTLIALFMILAGICYSCSRQNEEGLFFGREKTGVIDLKESDAGGVGADKEAGGESRSADDQDGSLPEERRSPEDGTLADAGREPDEGGAFGENPTADKNGISDENSGESAWSDTCFVHICGAVADPGVYELPGDSRIYQAVEAAGGLLPEADERLLNLAAPIVDGMKITVFTREEAGSVSEADVISVPATSPLSGLPGIGNTGSENRSGQVNINTAGKDELMTLKGIGESRAEDIIAYREKHGFFQKIEDIMKVPGIKDGAFQKIKDDITV